MRIEMELRNVPRHRVMEYLIDAGGIENGDLSVQGDNWRGWLEEMEPVQVITMTIRRDMLILESDDSDTLDEIHAFMRRKTMRGGG